MGRALLAELDHFAALTPGPHAATSIFFGGGTPSLMAPATVAAVIEAAAARTGGSRRTSRSRSRPTRPRSRPSGSAASARPGSTASRWACRHSTTPTCASSAASTAWPRPWPRSSSAAAIFPRRSFDLIYARPGQTEAAWEAELQRALAFADGHLSLYQLTIEPGTPFHAMVEQGRLVPLDEDRQATLYELTQAVLGAAGLPAYEISNHARPGQESRHNLVYWRYGDYVGIGPGAHGRLTLDGTKHGHPHRSRARAVAGPGRGGRARRGAARGRRRAEAQLIELLMMGLRLAEGVPFARIERSERPPLRRQRRREAARRG